MTPRTTTGRGRLFRHVALALGSALATMVLARVFHRDLRERVSTASAYVALALLAVTLSLGPLNVVRGRPNPVSFNLRRDFGIWAAIVGVAHAVIGLTVHMRGRMYLYFLPEPGHPSFAGLRADAFGLANDTGVVAALLLLVLATISNDIALRSLGTRRWRTLQRSAYVVFGLTVVHAAIYQGIEPQRLARLLALGALAGMVVVLQGMGVRRHQRRS